MQCLFLTRRSEDSATLVKLSYQRGRMWKALRFFTDVTNVCFPGFVLQQQFRPITSGEPRSGFAHCLPNVQNNLHALIHPCIPAQMKTASENPVKSLSEAAARPRSEIHPASYFQRRNATYVPLLRHSWKGLPMPAQILWKSTPYCENSARARPRVRSSAICGPPTNGYTYRCQSSQPDACWYSGTAAIIDFHAFHLACDKAFVAQETLL